MNNSHWANQGVADVELPGVKLRTSSANCAPKELHFSQIKTKSVGMHPLHNTLNAAAVHHQMNKIHANVTPQFLSAMQNCSEIWLNLTTDLVSLLAPWI